LFKQINFAKLMTNLNSAHSKTSQSMYAIHVFIFLWALMGLLKLQN